MTATEARLGLIRGQAAPRNHNARTIAALTSNPGCARRAVMDAAGVDKQRIAACLGFPAHFGQSQFAIARGNAFEAMVKANGCAELLRLLREQLRVPIPEVSYDDLEEVGGNTSRELRHAHTRRLLARAAASGEDAGTMFDHPLLLVQTADYARALFKAWRSADNGDELDQLVSARMARQSILDRPKPPMLWIVIDEAVLVRCIGSPKITRDQLEHLADLAERPKVTIQVVPGEVGAHVGLLGAFAIATFDHGPGIVYMESPDQGQTTDKHATVTKVSLTFDTLRAEALPRGASREMILKVAEEKWT